MAKKDIFQKDHLIDSHDKGIKLHLREKKPSGMKKSEAADTLLMVHGQSTPAPVAFDLPLPGYSWMDFAAARGFHVYALCIRGYEPSTRPPEMLKSPEGQPPAVRGITAVRDIDAAVRFICEQNAINKLNLLGWSWGTTTTAAFTAGKQARIRRLALYAPFYAYDNPQAAALSEDPARPGRWDPRKGAWRWVTEAYQRERWDGSIPKGQHEKWRTEKAIKRFWSEQLKFDPEGAKQKNPRRPRAQRRDGGRLRPRAQQAALRCEQNHLSGSDHPGRSRQKLDRPHFRRRVPRARQQPREALGRTGRRHAFRPVRMAPRGLVQRGAEFHRGLSGGKQRQQKDPGQNP